MIDAQLAAFLRDGLGIHIGTRDEQLRPNGARALAVKVDDDGRHLTVYVPKAGAARVLRDLESNGQAAVNLGRPTDDRACQVKGIFQGARPARPAEKPHVLEQWSRYLDNLERIGIPRESTSNWTTWPAVAVRIKVNAVFEQTPGPQAGTPLK